jgi:hypothetical protein
MSGEYMQRPITSEYPVLVALQGPLEGRRWLIKNSLEIGRDADCDITIEDRQVSRHHARVFIRDASVRILDLGSKNGTFFEGEQIGEEIRLSDGDAIQIALVQKFAFYSSDATMPIEDIDPALLKGTRRLQLDERSRRVWVRGNELLPPLSAAQFRLLYCLYEQSGQVVPRNELVRRTWDEEESAGVSEQALDALIRRLRDRLLEFDNAHQYIVTVRGHGTRLDNPIYQL